MIKSSARDHPDSASMRSHLYAILCETSPHKNTISIWENDASVPKDLDPGLNLALA